MIGNDVIDLLQSRKESNWQRRGFVEKLFTIDEQILIKKESNPENMIWLFWSMKEAAYKIYNRQTKRREFIPQKLSCKIVAKKNDCIKGQVSCEENIYYTKTAILNDAIHTIAVCSFNDLNKVIEIEHKEIFKDQYGIPYINNVLHGIQDVSISHHGRFEKTVTINKSS